MCFRVGLAVCIIPEDRACQTISCTPSTWIDLFSARTLRAARSVASTVPPSALLALRSSFESQGWSLCPPTPWAQTASFLYWRSLAGKNRQRFHPVRADNTGELDDHAPAKIWQRLCAVRFPPGNIPPRPNQTASASLAITHSVGRVVCSPVGSYVIAYHVYSHSAEAPSSSTTLSSGN